MSEASSQTSKNQATKNQTPINQFGTFKGVFTPSILTILGVILFLRMGWVVGQAGLIPTIFIITLSSIITFITGLSISSTATNSKVGPGGSYFLISRCFGVEIGAAIGLPLYLAQTLGITFYIVGFSESLALFFPGIPITTIAFITLVVLAIITFISSELALKMQVLIFAIIVVSLGSFFIGSGLESIEPPKSADDPVMFPFWAVFAVFFPAVTGIEAGISMSGDLKEPNKSLPIGTIAAVAIGYVVYVLAAIKYSLIGDSKTLITNSMIMAEVAAIPILIFLGLWGATLSSGLGAMLGAPRTLQALAKDRIFPRVLAKGTGSKNEPQIAMGVSLLIAACGLLIGDLNAIASILSMFFLTSYGALNLVSGLEGLVANPSWRPTFKTPWPVSITGAALCLGAMLMIDPGSSIVAIIVVFSIFFFMRKRNIRAQYSDIRSSLIMHFARNLIYAVSDLKKDARNWRPNFLVLSGSPKSRLYLIDLAYSMTQKRGFTTVAAILTREKWGSDKIEVLEDSTSEFLEKNKILALVKVTQSEDLVSGARALIKNYGIGNVTPNTIIFGDSTTPERIKDFSAIIHSCIRYKKNVLIIKKSQTALESIPAPRFIDVWWGGKNNNASLMLTFAYMLIQSKHWKNTTLRLRTMVDCEDERQGVQENLNQFIKSSRIDAEVDIVFESGLKDPLEKIVKYSQDSDFVFMGMKKPDLEQEPEAFASYYSNILQKTKPLPFVVFALAGEDIEFHKIFS